MFPKPLRLATLLAASLAAPLVGAAPICVTTPAELTAALATAGSDLADSEIRIEIGTYAAPAGGWTFTAQPFDAFMDLEISGGWIAGANCAAGRVPDSSLTKLSGTDSHRILKILRGTANGGTGQLRVASLSFVHAFLNTANDPDNIGIALDVESASNTGPIVVEQVIARDNTNIHGLGTIAIVHAGELRFRDNLVASNDSADGHMGVMISSIGGTAYVTSNTIADNTVLSAPDATLGLALFAGNGAKQYLTDNIVWHNGYGSDYRDLKVDASVAMFSNDVGHLVGTPDVQSTGTQSVDPKFFSSSDYRLTANSPVRDIGILTPLGGQAPYDLRGVVRPAGAGVDLGAYEGDDDTRFKNSFE